MIVENIEFKLKDGRRALIRSPIDQDIPEVLEYLYISAGETDFLLRYPEECTKYTAEGEKALFDRVNKADNEAMLVCLVEGKIAGNCQITWNNGLKTRHRASVAIALLREFWNQGIGTRLLQELIHIAESNRNIIQLELDFIERNTRARTLCERMRWASESLA